MKGRSLQRLDFDKENLPFEFTSAELSPEGQTLVLGSYDRYANTRVKELIISFIDRLHMINFSSRKNQWENTSTKILEGLHTIYALSWKPDGSRLVLVGDMFAG